MRVLLCSLMMAMFGVSVAQTSKWNEFYSLVNKDIKTVEALKTKDLGLRVRLFELYGEKLNLLIEKENDLRLQSFSTGDQSKVKKILSIQKSTLNKLESIARKIERQTRKPEVLTKINYYRALNYYLVKNTRKFYTHIKKAEKTNRDKKLGTSIYTKLADYHYNENQFKQAAFYYRKLISNKKSGWITKNLYNLSWSELKLGDFSNALGHLKEAHFFERKKGYFKIGNQLKDALMLFHAYAGKTKEGLAYMDKYRYNSFDDYIKYLHYVFENGERGSTKYVIARLEKMPKNPEQEFKFLDKKVIVYRSIKAFSLIQQNVAVFKRKLKKLNQKKVTQETRSELKNSILSYTGYLQELVKSKSFISGKTKAKYVRYVAYNFNILRSIDRENALKYSYYEGETYFSLRNYQRASYVYASGIKNSMKRGGTEDPIMPKSFDSLFKSLEKQKKPSTKILLFAFNSYLKVYPNGPKARLVHQRLINFHQAKGDNKNMLIALKTYNKKFPKDIKIQRDYYKSLLNKYIDKKDIGSLKSLKSLVDRGFLKFPKAESAKISTVITQIYFSKYEGFATKGDSQKAIDGFHDLYLDPKVPYELRVEALRKEMYLYHKKFQFKELTEIALLAIKFYKPKYKKLYSKDFVFYTENVCVGDVLAECISLVQAINKDKTLRASSAIKNLFFKIYTSKTKNYKKAYGLADNIEKKNFLFKLLVAEDSNFRHPLFKELYKLKNIRSIIDSEFERRFLSSFYNSRSFKGFQRLLQKTSLSSLKASYTAKINRIKRFLGQTSFRFTKTPPPQNVTAPVFGAFGGKFNQEMTGIIQNIQRNIQQVDPNFLPIYLTRVIANFEKETKKFKRFIPISKDSELEDAMNDELAKLHQFLDAKIIEYRQLYYRSLENTVPMSGARKYYDEIMLNDRNYKFGGLLLWQN